MEQLTEKQKKLLRDYDPALNEANLVGILEQIVTKVDELETRIAVLEAPAG